MPTIEEAKSMILKEIAGDDRSALDAYLARYGGEVQRFAMLMAQVVMAWQEFDQAVPDEKCGRISAVIFSAITLHIQSMELFLRGHLVASGNLMRQVLEAIAMSLLSSGKTLNILDLFVEGKYSTKNAVRDMHRNRKVLGLLDAGVDALIEAEKFCHQYSHLSQLTIASVFSFQHDAAFYVGASFDEGKVNGYDREMGSRMELAGVFPDFVEAVKSNIAKW
jgi:hypothetical protein